MFVAGKVLTFVQSNDQTVDSDLFLDSLTVFVVQDYASNKDKLEMVSACESLARNDCRASAAHE